MPKGLGEGRRSDPALFAGTPALHIVLLAWYRSHGRDLPWRRTRDPYRILVAEVMLQQTQVERVLPKYDEFLQRFPSCEHLAAASDADVIRAWAPLGYNTRAVRLRRIAVQVVQHWDGHLPSDPDELRRFKGLGPYTIAALRSYAFGQPDVPLDTNQRRVLGRLAGLDTAGDATLRQVGRDLLPQDDSYQWNQALMDLGATICLARAPRCPDCPLRDHCRFHRRSVTSALHEERGSYQVGRPSGAAAAFQGSRRQLRGRILHLLSAAPGNEPLGLSTLVAQLAGLGLTPDPEQLARAIEGLHHDGLLQVEERAGQPALRLP